MVYDVMCWYFADGEGACVSQELWKLYRQGLKPLAGLTKLGRSQRRDQTKPSTWSSRLWVGLTTPRCKNRLITTRGHTADLSETSAWGKAQATSKDRTLWRNIVVVALCSTGDEKDKKKICSAKTGLVLFPVKFKNKGNV